MIDIVPIVQLVALIAGPVLIARLVTGGEPVDLPRLVATLTEPPDPEIHEKEAARRRREVVERRPRTAVGTTTLPDCRPDLCLRHA